VQTALLTNTIAGKFHEAKSIDQTLEEGLNAISSFDANNDGKLSREEFATLVTTFAKAAKVSPHELIDFMVVTSGMFRVFHSPFGVCYETLNWITCIAAVKDNSSVEKAYIKSVKTRTSDENKDKESQRSIGGLWKNLRGGSYHARDP
jgi:hypothetical protein